MDAPVSGEPRNVTNLREVLRCPGCGRPIIRMPSLECGRCGQEHVLRAYVYTAGPGRFIAECLDLDILSQGASADDAIAALQEAVVDYLLAVRDPEGRVPMRPSPLSHQVRYWADRFVSKWADRIQRRHDRKVFSISAPEIREDNVPLRVANC